MSDTTNIMTRSSERAGSAYNGYVMLAVLAVVTAAVLFVILGAVPDIGATKPEKLAFVGTIALGIIVVLIGSIGFFMIHA